MLVGDIEVLEPRVSRYGHQYCMAVLDIDHFKAYNDTHGHQAGDRILETVADALKADARSGATLYRYGGEEFLCIFPEQSLVTGTQAVQRMQAGLELLAIPHPSSPFGVLTFSAGYRAKQLGRNRIEHSASGPQYVSAPGSRAS